MADRLAVPRGASCPEPTADADGLPDESPQSVRQREIERHESRNLLVLAAQEVVTRTGWIFKTESVIMPAFLDAVGGDGWLRGCLPVLNRLGQSVPPVFFAERLKNQREKSWSQASFSLAMAAPFLALAAVWHWTGAQPPRWMPTFFLVMYGVFFAANGLKQLSYGTLQGKLIRASHRGRLLAIGSVVGSVSAIGFAWWLLGGWLDRPDRGYTYIFAFTGVAFALAGLTTMLVVEPADLPTESTTPARQPLAAAWDVVRRDRNFRRLAMVVMLASVSAMLFPHYQALARDRLGIAGSELMLWVIVQNAATGVFGLLLGRLADRRGYRLCLALSLLISSAAPVIAIALAHQGPRAAGLFWLVFASLGLNPVMLRAMVNYALEICGESDHPRYLSTLNLCLAVPLLASPAIGWLVDATSFETVFLGGAGLVALSGLLTFLLEEPRFAH